MRLLGRNDRREPLSPRIVAIRHLQEHLDAGRAGLDPYDPGVFIVHIGSGERAFMEKALDLTGLVLTRVERPGGWRVRAVLEADVRDELGLDLAGAPLMGDEPLASRRVDHAGVAMDRILGALPRPPLSVVPDSIERSL